MIAIADAGFRSLGLDGFRLELTSLGDDTCRPQYRELLQEFLFELDLDEETRRRAEINPLRVLDDKRPHVREMTADAPLMLDHLSDVAKQHFDTVLAHLDALGVPYVINPRMVRGLDYYTKTTFEFVHDGLGAQSGIGGGGRYDGLMRQLGGQDLSGHRLRARRRPHGAGAAGRGQDGRRRPARVDVFGVPLGDAAKLALAMLAGELRGARACASTWPTATAGSRARCGPPTGRVRGSRWSPVTATSRRAPSASRTSRPGEQVDVRSDAVVADVLSRLV